MLKHRNHTENYSKVTDKAVIENALNRIINSPEFTGSERSKQFLEYVVNKHLSGKSKLINGTTIA